jgi:hypothetical protein
VPRSAGGLRGHPRTPIVAVLATTGVVDLPVGGGPTLDP